MKRDVIRTKVRYIAFFLDVTPCILVEVPSKRR